MRERALTGAPSLTRAERASSAPPAHAAPRNHGRAGRRVHADRAPGRGSAKDDAIGREGGDWPLWHASAATTDRTREPDEPPAARRLKPARLERQWRRRRRRGRAHAHDGMKPSTVRQSNHLRSGQEALPSRVSDACVEPRLRRRVHQLCCSLPRALTSRNTAAARATPARTMSVFDERCMKRVGAGATVGAAVGGAVGVQQPLPAPGSLHSACWCLQVLCMAPTRRSPTRWAPCCLIPLPWRGVPCGCL